MIEKRTLQSDDKFNFYDIGAIDMQFKNRNFFSILSNGPWHCHMALILFTVISFILLSSWAGHAGQGRGPMRTWNRFPPFLMFLTPAPESALTLNKREKKISMGVDYSSVFVNERKNSWYALIDMEMAVMDFRIEYGLTQRLTMGIEAPLVSMSRGFMDGFLDNYHTTFNFPDYGRSQRGKNEFAYTIRENSRNVIVGEEGGVHLADSLISAKYMLPMSNASISMAIEYNLKVPTGNPDHGYGSGHFDHGFFFLLQKDFFPWVVYLNTGLVVVSNPDTLGPKLETEPIPSLFLAGEYIYNKDWSCLIQLNGVPSPIKNTGISQLDDGCGELSLGFIRTLGKKSKLEASFSEDLIDHSAPDFNVHVMVSVFF